MMLLDLMFKHRRSQASAQNLLHSIVKPMFKRHVMPGQRVQGITLYNIRHLQMDIAEMLADLHRQNEERYDQKRNTNRDQ